MVEKKEILLSRSWMGRRFRKANKASVCYGIWFSSPVASISPHHHCIKGVTAPSATDRLHFHVHTDLISSALPQEKVADNQQAVSIHFRDPDPPLSMSIHL